MFVLVEEGEPRYDEASYEIIGVYSDKEAAMMKGAEMRYRNSVERKIAKLRGVSTPNVNDYVVWEVGEGGNKIYEPPNLSLEQKSAVDEDMAHALRCAEEERKKLDAEREEWSRRLHANEEETVRQAMLKNSAPANLSSLALRVALRTRDPDICKWAMQHYIH